MVDGELGGGGVQGHSRLQDHKDIREWKLDRDPQVDVCF